MPLSSPINSVIYQGNLPYPENILDLAEAFYHGFRCGVVHNAKIMEYGRINPDKMISPDIIQEKPWAPGTAQIEVSVNPSLLFKAVVAKFEDYLVRLRDKTQIDLRTKFANRFKSDTGITLAP